MKIQTRDWEKIFANDVTNKLTLVVKYPPANTGDIGVASFNPWVEKIHSNILTWRIPWTEESGRL